MIRPLLLTTSVLMLAACGAPDAEPGPAAPPAVPAQPATPAIPATPATTEAVTAQGWGPLRIGMTRAEVVTALGADSSPGTVGGPDPASCEIFRPARAPQGLQVMIEDGVLTSLWLDRGASLKTDRGFGVGDQAAAIKMAYGKAATVSPHKYSPAPAEYITAWSRGGAAGYVQDPAARGISYHIGTDGRVEQVAAGGPSIQYVEGCA